MEHKLSNILPKKVLEVFDKHLSSQQKDHKLIKLQEEVGELAQAYLKYIGSANSTSNNNYKDVYDLLEEIIDVHLVITDILNTIVRENPQITPEYIRGEFMRKITKFENRMKQRLEGGN